MALVSCRLRSGSSVTHAVFISTTPNGSRSVTIFRTASIGGLIRAPCTQTADDSARVVYARCEKDRVGTVAERIHVERAFDSVLSVAFRCAANVVHPQIPLDCRLREYDAALAVGIPTAGTPLQADNVAAGGLSLGNGHTCPFLRAADHQRRRGWLSRSVSRHGLLGFQLAIQSFPAKRCPPRNIALRTWPSTALWQSRVGGLLLVMIHLSTSWRS